MFIYRKKWYTNLPMSNTRTYFGGGISLRICPLSSPSTKEWRIGLLPQQPRQPLPSFGRRVWQTCIDPSSLLHRQSAPTEVYQFFIQKIPTSLAQSLIPYSSIIRWWNTSVAFNGPTIAANRPTFVLSGTQQGQLNLCTHFLPPPLFLIFFFVSFQLLFTQALFISFFLYITPSFLVTPC